MSALPRRRSYNLRSSYFAFYRGEPGVSLFRFCICGAVFIAGVWGGASTTFSDDHAFMSTRIDGRTLEFWVGSAEVEGGPQDIRTTVSALGKAVLLDDPKIKVAAADALAALGPEAKTALPALLAQFDHEYPWVRVSCQAAVGAVGAEAVEPLIQTMRENTGGPRIRAAFVLGGMGELATPAIDALLEIRADEPPAVQERLTGVLAQIDPGRFLKPTQAGSAAQFDPTGIRLGEEFTERDWPQFQGPRRDSISPDQGLLQQWPDAGPPHLWTLEGLGRGYSSVSISNGTMVTMGDRPAGAQEMQFVIAFDLASRRELWATSVGPAHPDGGPRCTPTLDGDRVYAIGTEGDVVCLNLATGAEVWRKHLVNDFGGSFMSVWQFSESPLVDGDRLICTPGNVDAMLVALDKQTGETSWKCAVPDLGDKGADGAGYSSAAVAVIGGVRQYVQLVGRGVIGVEAQTGRFLWGYNRVANNVANITSPRVLGDYVFATTAYNTGSALLKISTQDDRFRAEEVYFIPSREFQNHHGGVVVSGDYIYGGHGPNRGDPTCVNLTTGEVVWKERAPARGSAAVVYADGNLVFRYDRGEVVLLAATPDGMQIQGQFRAPDNEGPAWAYPVVHGGKLFLRHADALYCYDLRAL